MSSAATIYVFRDPHFAPGGDTVVAAATSAVVAQAFGGGGMFESGGLSEVFGGAAAFRDDATGAQHLAVWGARKAARFRAKIREAGFDLEIVQSPPPGRLFWYATR